jgi:hypothetical protein
VVKTVAGFFRGNCPIIQISPDILSSRDEGAVLGMRADPEPDEVLVLLDINAKAARANG